MTAPTRNRMIAMMMDLVGNFGGGGLNCSSVYSSDAGDLSLVYLIGAIELLNNTFAVIKIIGHV